MTLILRLPDGLPPEPFEKAIRDTLANDYKEAAPPVFENDAQGRRVAVIEGLSIPREDHCAKHLGPLCGDTSSAGDRLRAELTRELNNTRTDGPRDKT
ncbi:hypothetical protein [Massilia sp. Leaf139]|uniref:hypothetical protein n=1 Tax=Massilia sp. Leaf139 TaxID=1736272 RepID=UPI0007139E6F|nr:hypothetical protein [Massilia sp. Leaf139]KQQ97036.1 hypothetical protein ASF77_03465 [Massilia sp. Leaf139]